MNERKPPTQNAISIQAGLTTRQGRNHFANETTNPAMCIASAMLCDECANANMHDLLQEVQLNGATEAMCRAVLSVMKIAPDNVQRHEVATLLNFAVLLDDKFEPEYMRLKYNRRLGLHIEAIAVGMYLQFTATDCHYGLGNIMAYTCHVPFKADSGTIILIINALSAGLNTK